MGAGSRGAIIDFSLHFGWERAVSQIAPFRQLYEVGINIDVVAWAAREVGAHGGRGRGAVPRAHTRGWGEDALRPPLPRTLGEADGPTAEWGGGWGKGGNAKLSASQGLSGRVYPKVPLTGGLQILRRVSISHLKTHTLREEFSTLCTLGPDTPPPNTGPTGAYLRTAACTWGVVTPGGSCGLRWGGSQPRGAR